MSDQPMDLRAILARIDRDLAESAKLREETNKFVAEQHRMTAEAAKFNAERTKLTAEAAKLDRDRWLAPALAIAAVIGGLLGVASFIAKVIQ
jgi:Skp family chaperone for outer membrane proteins